MTLQEKTTEIINSLKGKVDNKCLVGEGYKILRKHLKEHPEDHACWFSHLADPEPTVMMISEQKAHDL